MVEALGGLDRRFPRFIMVFNDQKRGGRNR
jgi:hypothetical protein